MKKHFKIPTLIVGILISLNLLMYTNCSQLGNEVDSEEDSSSETLALSVQETQLYFGQSTYVTAEGGTEPYTYTLVSGKGSIESSTGYYTAPTASTTTARIKVTDADSNVSYVYVYVYDPEDVELTLSTTSQSIYVGEDIDISASGGNGDYSFSITDGEEFATLSSNTLTAVASGSVVVQATDTNGSQGDITITIVADAKISLQDKVLTDHYVGISFDYSNYELDVEGENPAFIFVGTGDLTSAGIAKNTSGCTSAGEVNYPCITSMSLENFRKDYTGDRSYKGTIIIRGRSHTVQGEFCIRSTNRKRVYMKWTTSSSLSYGQISYSENNLKAFDGNSHRWGFQVTDTNKNAGESTLQIQNAGYVDSNQCGSGFTSSQYIE